MIKKIEVSDEILQSLKKGKNIEGALRFDPEKKTIFFKAWNRKYPKIRKHDKVICYHENGWLKESENNLKFFTSVKKHIGAVRACQVMERDLEFVTGELFQKLENGEYKSDDLKLY